MGGDTRLTAKWRDLSTERTQAITDGVMGIVVALAAYVVMSIDVAGWGQWGVLLGVFALLFFLALFAWDLGANAVAIAPHDNRLLVLAVVQALLLIPVAFSARLAIDSPVQKTAASLLIITTGAVLGLTGIMSVIGSLSRDASAAPHWVLADLRAAAIGGMAGLLTAFLCVLLLPGTTIRGVPWPGISAKTFGLVWSFGASFTGMFVATLFIRKRNPPPSAGSSGLPRVREAISTKTKSMINELFGMALGLGAFSLTDLVVQDAVDLLAPYVHFGFLCFLILVFWSRLFRAYSVIPADEELLDFLVDWKAFFVVLVPPVFRLAVLPGTVTRQIGSTVFPLVIAMLALTSGILYLHAGGFIKGTSGRSSSLRPLFARWAVGSFALVILFPLSLLVPPAVSLGQVSLRVIIWWVVAVCFVVFTSLGVHGRRTSQG